MIFFRKRHSVSNTGDFMKKEKTFFGKQLKKIILEKNITQQELADKLNIARPMISNWMNGFRNPSLASIQKIANALDVSIDYFIENGKEKTLDEKDIKILQLEKENLELKLKLKEVFSNISERKI